MNDAKFFQIKVNFKFSANLIISLAKMHMMTFTFNTLDTVVGTLVSKELDILRSILLTKTMFQAELMYFLILKKNLN